VKEYALAHSLNNQGGVEGLSIAAAHGQRGRLNGPPWLAPEKQQRGEVGDLFSTVCPLSAAPMLRSQLTPPADCGISDSTMIRRDDHRAS
jgi:hypothetical protein